MTRYANATYNVYMGRIRKIEDINDLDIPKVLLEARKNARWTRKDMFEKTGIPQRSIEDMENGVMTVKPWKAFLILYYLQDKG